MGSEGPQNGYRNKPLYPKQGRPEYRNKASQEAMLAEFGRLCLEVGFGRIEVEVANGAPKSAKVMYKDYRIDLTAVKFDGTIKPSDNPGPAHDGEPERKDQSS